MRRFPMLTFAVIANLGMVAALSAQSILEVSTVKPHPGNAPCGVTRVSGAGRVEIACFTLEIMLREGFNVLQHQITGGPEWVRQELWDIVAKDTNATGKLDEDVYREVLLAVAYERFSVKLHTEKRAAKGFSLTVANAGKLGPSLAPASGQPHLFETKRGPAGPYMIGRGISMTEFTSWLKWFTGAGKMVEDKTGLTGLYDVDLHWAPPRTDQTTDPAVD